MGAMPHCTSIGHDVAEHSFSTGSFSRSVSICFLVEMEVAAVAFHFCGLPCYRSALAWLVFVSWWRWRLLLLRSTPVVCSAKKSLLALLALVVVEAS
jgi:hypothetical protein